MPIRPTLVAASTLTAGLALFRWGHGPLRGFGGDALVVVLLVAALAAGRVGSPRSRLLGVGALAVGAELFQGLGWVGADSHWLLHLTVGSTFDPLDLLAYAAGLVAAAALERWWALQVQARHPQL